MEKILIIKMSALGDIFMAMPHMEIICRHHSEAEKWILTGNGFQDIFRNHPVLKTTVLDKKAFISSCGMPGRIIWIRKQRFDVIYDLQGNSLSRKLVRWSGAGRCVGTQPDPVYHSHPEKPYTRDLPVHVFDRLNETIASAGLPPATVCSRIFASGEDTEAVELLKKEYGITDGGYAVLHAGSSRGWSSKRWPVSCFGELAVMLEKKGVRCVWVGGGEDRHINAELARKAGVDATGRLSILQLHLFGKGAKFAVTGDSGPMHILSATGIPVYSFFGPTNWLRTHGLGQKERVLKNDTACSPCFMGRCPEKYQHACMRGISPEKVFDRIQNDIRC